jgi:hypothetical protein
MGVPLDVQNSKPVIDSVNSNTRDFLRTGGTSQFQNLVNHVLHQSDGVLSLGGLSLSSHLNLLSHRKLVNLLVAAVCLLTAAT